VWEQFQLCSGIKHWQDLGTWLAGQKLEQTPPLHKLSQIVAVNCSIKRKLTVVKFSCPTWPPSLKRWDLTKDAVFVLFWYSNSWSVYWNTICYWFPSGNLHWTANTRPCTLLNLDIVCHSTDCWATNNNVIINIIDVVWASHSQGTDTERAWKLLTGHVLPQPIQRQQRCRPTGLIINSLWRHAANGSIVALLSPISIFIKTNKYSNIKFTIQIVLGIPILE